MHTIAGGTSSVTSEAISGKASPKLSLDAKEVDPAGEDMSKLYAFEYPSYPQRPIVIDSEWAKYLNPTILTQNTTVWELIMRQKFFPNAENPVPVEGALTAMMINGLTRVGMGRNLQGSIRSIHALTVSHSLMVTTGFLVKATCSLSIPPKVEIG